jgi:uncharacterized membrane protein YkvA (DUF1232 family)
MSTGSNYSQHFSDEGFWDKVTRFGAKLGRESLERVATLYYCMCDPDTSWTAKAAIVAALGYFVLPLDVVPDIIPVAGFADDAAIILNATLAVAAHVKEEHRQKARVLVGGMLGEAC